MKLTQHKILLTILVQKTIWGRGLLLVFALSLHLLMVSTAEAKPLAQGTCSSYPTDYDDFYEVIEPNSLSSEDRGKILRVEHLKSYSLKQVADAAGVADSRFGAELYRILYVSQSSEEVPQAVSGLLAIPTNTSEKQPLLVNGHATLGLSDRCAPSRSNAGYTELIKWMAHGFTVVSTDYVGLGMPGLHPYMIGQAAGFGMLDSARAASNFCDEERNISVSVDRVILHGHSQGGHAALFAHQLWPAYAPELNVLGTVTYAPGAEFRYLAEQMAIRKLSGRVAPVALSLYAYQKYYGAPDNLDAWLQEPFASEIEESAENKCILGITSWLGFDPEEVFQPELLVGLKQKRWSDLHPWTGYIDQNTPGNFQSSVPVLIIQGSLDSIVLPQASRQLMEQLCYAGTPTQLTEYAGVGHIGLPAKVFPDALDWISDRLDDLAIVDSCVEDLVTREPQIHRPTEPVIVDGSMARQLVGVPTNELFIYINDDSTWRQIPYQVDEKTEANEYTELEDGLFDINDEIVFMAKDLGEGSLANLHIGSALLPDPTWTEIKVTNPLSPDQSGWAYIVHSVLLTQTFDVDYVEYDRGIRRIQSNYYALGLPVIEDGFDYLSLSGGANILERTHIRVDCAIPLICPITENFLPQQLNQRLVKDGPVRVILNNGQIIAYDMLVSWSRSYDIPNSLRGEIQVSTNFNDMAQGAIYYNSVEPDGVTIDGLSDVVAAQPASPWWQISTGYGSLIQITDIDRLRGVLSNVYVDDANAKPNPQFGTTGLSMASFNNLFDYRYLYHILPDPQPNVGAQHLEYFENPLLIEIVEQDSYKPDGAVKMDRKLYLPLVH